VRLKALLAAPLPPAAKIDAFFDRAGGGYLHLQLEDDRNSSGCCGPKAAEGMGPIHARGILSELRKRFGKRYTVRKVDGKSVRVFAGVRLIDALPARSGVTVSAA
jgi:hypothetical protein